jgi:nucleoside-diphosphate-sugar epimerase
MLRPMKPTVTGSTGFIGRALVSKLVSYGYAVTPVACKSGGDEVGVSDIDEYADWSAAFNEVDVIVHVASRVHVTNELSSDPLDVYREVNVRGTERLATEAFRLGVFHVGFISSIKVNGESAYPDKPLCSYGIPAPQDAYGLTKCEVEQALWGVADKTGLKFVVVRPPLVYRLGVRANFLRLMQLVKSGIQLPLGSIDNRRALVSLDKLLNLIMRCIEHPAAHGNTFLVSDGNGLSTPVLIRGLAAAIECKARLWLALKRFLRVVGHLSGNYAELSRLFDSLQVNISETCKTLDWAPPIPVEEGLRSVATPLLA